MNANIIKTHIFYKKKYDLQGHQRSHKVISSLLSLSSPLLLLLSLFATLNISLSLSFFFSLSLYEPTLPLMISPHYVRSSQPVSSKREGDATVPSFALFDLIFLKIKHDLRRPVLCYGEVLRFFKMSQSFDQIISSTIHKKSVTLIFDLFFLTTSF